MVVVIQMFFIIFWLNSAKTLTKYLFETTPKLDIILGRQLHLYVMVIPGFIQKVAFNYTYICPVSTCIVHTGRYGTPYTHLLKKHTLAMNHHAQL